MVQVPHRALRGTWAGLNLVELCGTGKNPKNFSNVKACAGRERDQIMGVRWKSGPAQGSSAPRYLINLPLWHLNKNISHNFQRLLGDFTSRIVGGWGHWHRRQEDIKIFSIRFPEGKFIKYGFWFPEIVERTDLINTIFVQHYFHSKPWGLSALFHLSPIFEGKNTSHTISLYRVSFCAAQQFLLTNLSIFFLLLSKC